MLILLTTFLFCRRPSDGVENTVELPEQQVEEEPLETMTFIFNIESLGLVLYSNDPKQVRTYR